MSTNIFTCFRYWSIFPLRVIHTRRHMLNSSNFLPLKLISLKKKHIILKYIYIPSRTNTILQCIVQSK